MTLQPNSNAGKVRAAFTRLGWDASVDDVIKEVGKVVHSLGGRSVWDANSGRWVANITAAYLPKEYILTVRRDSLRRGLNRPKPIPLDVYDWV